jgi:putative lipoic acid-binding regulatory protein
MFPIVFDTKCMGTALAMFSKTNLKVMHQHVLQKKFTDLIQF